jgi:hypothetical protein
VVVEEPTFIVTPIKASTYPSPSKIGLDVTETPVARRRRAPEPGTISLFGVKGAGVISPPEVPLDIESPSTRHVSHDLEFNKTLRLFSILFKVT